MQRIAHRPATFDVPHGIHADAAPAAPAPVAPRDADVLALESAAVRLALSTVRAHTRSIVIKATRGATARN